MIVPRSSLTIRYDGIVDGVAVLNGTISNVVVSANVLVEVGPFQIVVLGSIGDEAVGGCVGTNRYPHVGRSMMHKDQRLATNSHEET